MSGAGAANQREDEIPLAELMAEVRRIEVFSRRLVADALAGGYRSVFRGSGVEFEEVREYEEGDDPRSVDWNVTARLGRPFVKKFVDERELTILFVLDLSASMQGGFAHWSARQAAARICGVLALAALQNQDKVGLIAVGDGVQRYLPPRRGFGHALRLIRECLTQATAPRADLGAGLEFVSRVTKGQAVVFVISDFMDVDFEAAATPCALKHDLIAVRMLAPELEALAPVVLSARDPETGAVRRVDWRDAGSRQRYEERVATWRRETEELFARLGIDRLDLPLPRDAVAAERALAGPLVRFFRTREMRGGRR
jgi:uncharacterized protein (DUF58 family)